MTRFGFGCVTGLWSEHPVEEMVGHPKDVSLTQLATAARLLVIFTHSGRGTFFKLNTKAFFIASALLVLPAISYAAPIKWSIDGIFTDGTAIRGSFNYDNSLEFEEDRITGFTLSTSWGFYDQNSNSLCNIISPGRFHCFKERNTDISFTYSSLANPNTDATFGLFEDCRSAVCNYEFRNGSGQLTNSLAAIPLPASFGMLGAALLAFSGFGSARKRGRRTSST